MLRLSFWHARDDRGTPRAVRPKQWCTWDAIPEVFVTVAIVWVTGVMISGVIVAGVVRADWLGWGPVPRLVIVGVWACVVLKGVWSGVRFLRRRARVLAAVEIGEGRCAACGYDIRAQPVEADGCAVCPECGGAWRMGGTESSRTG